MTEPILRVEGVCARIGRTEVLAGVTFEISAGAYAVLAGPNGAGKTTLLRILLGTIRPAAGEIRWSGARPRIGYLPQRDAADPVWPLTPLDLARLARAARAPWGWLAASDETVARRALARAGIEDLADRPLRDLSGGQFQRALLARALAVEPEVLVLDEPTRGLDVEARTRFLADLARENATGMTILLCTHDPDLADSRARRVLRIEGGRLA